MMMIASFLCSEKRSRPRAKSKKCADDGKKKAGIAVCRHLYGIDIIRICPRFHVVVSSLPI